MRTGIAAHPKCSGKVTLWYRGEEVFRVTARKDEWGEVKDFICNECRFEKKATADWEIEGPTRGEPAFGDLAGPLCGCGAAAGGVV